ncbi:hypothetical protein, partial [Nocardia asiatica]|uniref:hypothetical protein n=1 Tax=Nocardia asiatica TaxID=209252 RepID=UPI002454DEA4
FARRCCGSGQSQEQFLQLVDGHRLLSVGGSAGEAFAQSGSDDLESGARPPPPPPPLSPPPPRGGPPRRGPPPASGPPVAVSA